MKFRDSAAGTDVLDDEGTLLAWIVDEAANAPADGEGGDNSEEEEAPSDGSGAGSSESGGA